MASFSSKTMNFILFIITIICCINANHVLAKSKPTHVSFYQHENLQGPNANLQVVVAPPNPNSSVGFGLVGVFDDVLRIGFEPTSPIIGRIQGVFAETSLEKVSYISALNVVFTSGDYNGSTLSVMGKVTPSVAERPVVGGTGVFRFTRGYMINNPIIANNVTYIAKVDIYLKY